MTDFTFPNNDEYLKSITTYGMASDLIHWFSSLYKDRQNSIINEGLFQLTIFCNSETFECSIQELIKILPFKKQNFFYQLSDFSNIESVEYLKPLIESFLHQNQIIKCKWHTMYIKKQINDKYRFDINTDTF